MVKLILLLTRREGISVEEFQRYAREQHAPLLRQLPGLTRLVVNYAQPDHTGTAPQYDAIAEDWFESGEAMAAAFQSPAGQAVQQDAANFLDLAKFQMIMVQEDEVMSSRAVASA
jgi:uncharacterized protein (TIGR02118 family)